MSYWPSRLSIPPFLLVAGLVLLTGCQQIIDFTPMAVTLSPSQADSILSQNSSIQVNFSFDIQRSTAESITSLLFNGQAVAIDFQWSGNILTIVPQAGLDPGGLYILQVSGTVTSQSGSTKTVTDQVPFYYLFQGTPPVVSSTSPNQGSNLAPSVPISITFSEAMDPSTLARGLSISPVTPFTSSWSTDGTILTLTPQTNWPDLSVLTVAGSADLKSRLEQSVAAAFSFHFWVQDSSPVPSVSAVGFYSRAVYNLGNTNALTPLPLSNPNWTDLLGITFNEAVDFTSFSTGTTVLPTVSGHWENISPTFFLFIPDIGWNQNTAYSLTAPTIKTPGGTSSGAAYTDNWTTATTIPSQTVTMTVTVSGTQTAVPSGDSASPVSISYTTPTDQLVLTLTFGQPITNAYESSLVSNSIISPLMPSTASGAQLFNLTFANSTVLTLSYNVIPPSSGSTALYQVVIPGGSAASTNSDGSYLPTNVTFLFTLQG